MDRDSFLDLRLRNAERTIAKRLRQEKARRALVDSIEELTMPQSAGDDIPVRRLPPTLSRESRDFYAHMAIREALFAHADGWDEDELRFADLWLRGHSPRAIFLALGIPSATGYRRYGEVVRELKEVCHG